MSHHRVMLFAYIDESYQQDHYYLGAVLFTGEQLALLENSVDDWCQKWVGPSLGVDVDIEFHGHRIMQGAAPWTCLQGNVRQAESLYRRFLRLLVASGAQIYIEGVDVSRLNARYKYPDPPYVVTLRHLLEKLDTYAKKCGEEIFVVADEIGDSDTYAAIIGGYTQTGTPGYRSSKLLTIKQPIRFHDSEHERGIQAADMVAYIARRHLEPGESEHPKATKTARSLYNELRAGSLVKRKWSP